MDFVKDEEPPKRAHLKQLAKHKGVQPEFEDDYLPDEIAYFHGLFFEIWDMSAGMTYQNIFYWQQIYGVTLGSDVIKMFKEISAKCNEFIRKKLNPPKVKGK